MYLDLGLDILLIVLLLPTLVYVVLLHRRLSSLRADREAVDTVVERMNEATRRADAALKGIRQAAEQAKTTLDEPTVRAQALRDELHFLVQRADAAGERLAGGLSSAGAGGSAPEPGAGTGPRAGGTVRPAEGVSAAARGKPVGRAARPGEARPAAPAEAADDVRSQAERDLLNALRNVR